MCGIAGFNWKNRTLGEKMQECLLHRGPDAHGVFEDSEMTLSHSRLAIIDLTPEANQPLHDFSNRYVIVFNGEIYNYRELKKELKDYDFKTESDTEVILAGYEKWGREVVQRLNGIFAFAIWDKKEKELFAARDHLGVKPFYYYWDNRKFIFASEVKSILVHDISRELNIDSFNRYLRVLYSPEPETFIKNISKLPPGGRLLLKGIQLKVEKYYTPQIREQLWSYEDAIKAVNETVTTAVQRQLVADVPVGVYLSGGIDSSVVLSSVAKVKANIKTFSIGFDLTSEEQSEKFNRDFDLAEKTAKFFGAEHHPLKISTKDVVDNLERVIGTIDDPISNPTAIPMALLSKFAKQDVTVALSGNGGDELFGGYERYRLSRIRDLLSFIPLLRGGNTLDKLELFEFQKDPVLRRVVRREVLEPTEWTKSFFKKYLPEKVADTAALMNVDLTSWLPDQALSLGDRMSMLGSLEERVPLLDRKVVELALTLPLSFKVNLKETKRILKDAFRPELPEELYKEPKRGWFSPGAKWLRNPEILSIAEKILEPGYYQPTARLFDWPMVQEMLQDHVQGKRYNLTMLWAIMTFQIWARRYKIDSL